MAYSEIVIIYNPNSTGESEQLARDFARDLRPHVPEGTVQLTATTHAGHAEEIAYRAASTGESPLIISSSGDGGYNEVVNGALKAIHEGHAPTTGLLPAGNANDHYHNLHAANLIEQIVDGGAQQIDVLVLTGMSKGKPMTRYAHSYIGFGVTPVIGNELNKTALTPIKEWLTVARSLLGPTAVRLKMNGKTRSYESIVCSNVDVMSKYLKISSPSSITDGKFEVTIFRKRRKITLLWQLLKSAAGNTKEDLQVRKFSLTTTRKTLAQLDGEIIQLDSNTDVAITIEAQALPSIV